MGEIPNHVLNDLIGLDKLSENDNAERNQIFNQLRPYDRCGRNDANTWISISQDLDSEKLSALVRGLVFAEETLKGWCGGSVSGINWLFLAYQKKSPENADKLADWILQHSTNNYVPFGMNRGGVRSVAEFASYRKAKELRRSQSEKHAEAERHSKTIREAVARRHQKESVILQRTKTQLRNELLSQLDKLSTIERLEHIAWDDEHDLIFYPENYAKVTQEEFHSLDDITRDRLISKIKLRHKGCWAKLFSKVVK